MVDGDYMNWTETFARKTKLYNDDLDIVPTRPESSSKKHLKS